MIKGYLAAAAAALTISVCPASYAQAPSANRPARTAPRPPAAAPRAAAENGAAIISFEDTVDVARPGKSGLQRVSIPPFELVNGDEIRTGPVGKATIRLTDGSQVTLGPRALFTFAEESKSRVFLRLSIGRLWAVVTQARSRAFEVWTPVAVAAVRGTEFSVEALSAKQTAVEVFGGAVAVKGALGDEALLLSRQRVDVTDGHLGRPEHFEPRPADLGAVRQARQAQGQKVEADEDSAKGKQVDSGNDALKAELEREVGFQVSRDAVESAAAFEMKSALFQQGKDIVDAFGQRVRLEQYMLRPTPSSFKFVSLNFRADRLDFGSFEVVANAPLPDDLSQAGDLWFSPGATAPPFFAVKERSIYSNTSDSVVQLGVDGQSVSGTFQQDVPVCGANGCAFTTGAAPFFQTVFGNQYEFINGNPSTLSAIWNGASCPAGTCAARPADAPGMMWRTQPVQVNVLPVAGGPAIASYWQDSFMVNTACAGAACPGGTGKGFIDDFTMPDPNLAHFIQRRDYLKFQDNALGLGFVNWGEPTIDGKPFGSPGVPVFQHFNQRLDGTVAVALPAGQRAATATTVFADNNGTGLPGGTNPTAVPTSDSDPLLFSLQGKSNTWLQAEDFLIDDLGNVARLDQLFASATGETGNSQLFEGLNFERSITSSQFAGRKIDVVLDPLFFVESSVQSASSNGTAASP